ncbi:MAG: D-alanine--D-alanine ligase, partial [Acutalibacteraceae bacterium]|nr:D-alanine--D-alanine ligase [Acutalibacteraceae bacterium]
MVIDNGLINVAVFFGGDSVEHEVSIISAVQAMTHLNREKYNVIPIYLAKNGIMYTSSAMFEINSFRNMKELMAKSPVASIFNDGQSVILKTVKKNDFSGRKPMKLDVALPIVHGTNCEDGSLQGYFETLRLPYAGCDVLASSVGMDKAIFKSVLRTAGIPVLDCI